MKTQLMTGETILKQGAANLQKNIETVGGWLFLTNFRLIFEAHKLNVQGGISEMDLRNVKCVENCWTKFLGIIPLFPNSLAVLAREGTTFRLVLFQREAWAAAITQANLNQAAQPTAAASASLGQ